MAGCVHTGSQEAPQVPAVLQPLFMSCAPADGASAMQIFQGDSLLGSVEVEGLAKAGGDWDVEATNAVGLPVLKLSRRGAKIAASGGLAGKLPRLSVRKDGFLLVDGHMVGIKATEIPCLLAFRLPRPWFERLTDVDTEGGRIVLGVEEKSRDIEIVAKGLAESKATAQVCSQLSWTRLLVFTSELHWCQSVTGRQEATLRGVEDYALKWTRIDESH